MKATIKDGEIKISLHELAESMSDDDRRELMQFALYQEVLLQAVVETVAEGSAFEGGWSIGNLATRMREALLPLLPTAMRELVRDLKNQVALAKSSEESVRSALWNLSRHWPAEVQKPDADENRHWLEGYKPITRDEAEQYIAEQLGPVWEEIKAANQTPAE